MIKDTHCIWRGNPLRQFGALLAELEFQCLGLRRTLTELYTNASFFVHFLGEAGPGIVLQEPMAYETPMVGTRCGGPETVVMEDQTGFLVSLGDARALAAQDRYTSRLGRDVPCDGCCRPPSRRRTILAGRRGASFPTDL